MTQQLSPVAQAVLIAFLGDAKDTGLEIDDMRENLASALRVVVTAIGAEEMLHPDSNRTEGVKWCVQRIYAIAVELEAQ